MAMFGKNGKKISLIVLVICFIVLAGSVAFKYYNTPTNSPELSYSSIIDGVRNNSIAQVESAVDIHAVASNVIDQIFKQQPKQEQGVLNQIGNWAERKYASFIRPEMVTSLEKQIVRFVSVGVFAKSEDKAILTNLRNEILGKNGSFGQISKFQVKGIEAIASLPIIRSDIPETLNLKLLFAKQDKKWLLVAIPNLNSMLEKIEGIRKEKIRLANIEIQQQLQDSLKPLAITKSSGITKWGVGSVVIIQGEFENISNKDIKSFHAFVDIIEKQNSKTLKTVAILDTDMLLTGDTTEKSWPLTVNPLSADDRRIYELPAEEIKWNVRFSEIIFSDDTKIELLRE